jgi:hypothetical protein
MPAGAEAVMADALEAVRQGVQQEPADELLGRERPDLVVAAGTIIGPTEADAVSCKLINRLLAMATRWV